MRLDIKPFPDSKLQMQYERSTKQDHDVQYVPHVSDFHCKKCFEIWKYAAWCVEKINSYFDRGCLVADEDMEFYSLDTRFITQWWDEPIIGYTSGDNCVVTVLNTHIDKDGKDVYCCLTKDDVKGYFNTQRFVNPENIIPFIV